MSEYTDEQLDRIDELVRQHIFGWGKADALAVWDEGFHPTRDPGQAMEVLEQCRDWMFVCWGNHAEVGGYHGYRDAARHVLRRPAWTAGEMDWGRWVTLWYDVGPTPMIAICIAALRKKGVEVPGG